VSGVAAADVPSGSVRAQDTSPARLALAIVSAWLVPGLGHLLLGRVGRGLLFAAIVLGSFALGMAHEGRVALCDDRQPFLSALQVVANAGVGPADLFARIRVYGAPAYALPKDHSDPAYDDRVRILRARTRSKLSIYGTAYLWTAGLMNLLLLFDVWDIGRARRA
jgi:hypothetical protein